MNSSEIRQKYIRFFENLGHKKIEQAPLVLENDPTTLFTSSGMQPLVPYLMGESHPSGKRRLVDSQPCLRTVDIDEVGDNRHLTFFEMLGNWSLGDYFKKEQLSWIYDFFTKELDLDKDRLWVSVFEGNGQVTKDTESAGIWAKLGIPKSRIFYYGADKNWWSRSGTPAQMPVGEIGGPDSEVFYDFGEELGIHDKSPFKNQKCHPNCDCGRFLEIGNSVFIQYKKIGEGKLEELPNKNVDFGGGLERIATAVINDPDIYKTDLFSSLVNEVGKFTDSNYEKNKSVFRVIADHIKASIFLISGGVEPSNKLQGYVLRRLIRRCAIKFHLLGRGLTPIPAFNAIGNEVIRIYRDILIGETELRTKVSDIFGAELNKFGVSLDKGLKVIKKSKIINGKVAFDLYQTFGFPLEVTRELAIHKGQKVEQKVFEREFERHKNQSRTTSAGVFKGGLADHSPEVVRLHTATHLLLASLRKVLGEHVVQKGQNITKERSRFDFLHPNKLSNDDLGKVEELINSKIKANFTVGFKIMPRIDAEKTGAIHAFNEKYTDTVKVYFVGKDLDSAFSKEFCGGPHVSDTGEIGRVRIIKQEKLGADTLRIYLKLE